jgi:hypothetical protein
MYYILQKPFSMNIDEEWKNLVQIMEKAANEALGKKKEEYQKKQGLKIWNEETEAAINQKQKVYLNYLQKQTEQAKNNYKTHRNTAKHKVRMAHQESWEKFISTIEHDVHDRQQIAYKAIK